MRKTAIALIMILFITAGCGGANAPDTTDVVDDLKNETVEIQQKDYLTYQFVMPGENTGMWPVGVHVPEGFFVDDRSFESSGSIAIISEDDTARFQFSVLTFNGNTDAFVHFDQVIKGDTMKSATFVSESHKGPVYVPYPGEEDITHCESTSVLADFTREDADGNVFIGEVRLYWFDVRAVERERVSASMGIFMLSESAEDEWSDSQQALDTIRKSMLLLPSKREIDDKMGRASVEGDFETKLAFARDELEYKLMQIRGGSMPAPGWQTLLETMVPAYGDVDESFYLVEFVDTPSGLLDHPEVSGMTVDPNLSRELFYYLRDDRF